MASELKFDIEKLQAMRKKCQEAEDDMEELKNDLKKGLEQLREDWQTDAGRKFFANSDYDWETQVEQYKQTIRRIRGLLETAIVSYHDVMAEANEMKV